MRSALMACLLLALAASAQDEQESELQRVQRDQARVEARLDGLRDKMERLAARYDDEGRTRNARLLREAIAQFDADRLLDLGREVSRSLDQAMLSSIEQQDALIASLESVYSKLRDRRDVEDLAEQSETARQGAADLSLLAATQRRLLADTRAATDQPADLVEAALSAAQRSLEQLARTEASVADVEEALRQMGTAGVAEALERAQRELAQAPSPTGEQQAALQAALELLAQQLESTPQVEGELGAAAADALREAGGSGDSAAEAMSEAQQALSEQRAEEAREDMRRAADRLGEMAEQAADAERSLTAARNRGHALALTSSRDASKSAEDVQEMAQRLEAVEPQAGPELLDRTRALLEELARLAPAVEADQTEAASQAAAAAQLDLNQIIAMLQARAGSAGQEPPAAADLESLAQRQEDVLAETRRLMERLSELPDQAHRESLQRAATAMERAGQALRAQDAEQGAMREEEASEQLEQAQEELSGDRRRYEQLRQEELLFRLGEELASLQTRQQAISEETLDIDGQRGEEDRLGRSQSRAVVRLASSETDLASETETLRASVAEDGARSFDFALAEVRDSMSRAAELLRDEQTGAGVQTAQQDVQQRLADLLAVLDMEMERRREAMKQPQDEQSAPPPGSEDAPQPLVPPVAELLLIQRMEQMALNRLENFERLHPQVNDFERELLDRWANEHLRVSELFRQMVPAAEASP